MLKICLGVLVVTSLVLNAFKVPQSDSENHIAKGFILTSTVICKKNFALAVVITTEGVAMQQLMTRGTMDKDPLKPVRCK